MDRKPGGEKPKMMHILAAFRVWFPRENVKKKLGVLWLVRCIANWIRSGLLAKLRYPWAKFEGFRRIPFDVVINPPNHIFEIGNNVQFGRECIIENDLLIGSNVLIARRVSFVGRMDHDFTVVGKRMWDSPRGKDMPIVIENDVWIGHGAIILANVRIGEGSIIGAGSLVAKDVPSFSIFAGVPAKKISNRFQSEDLEKHKKIIHQSK